MTAYGQGDATIGTRSWTVEIRSVNHRHLDIKVKLPKKYLGLEEQIKKEIANHYSRGHVDVLISPGPGSSEPMNLTVNLDLARNYFNCLEQIARELSLAEKPTLAMVKDLKEIIVAQEEEEDLETVWPAIREAVNSALTNGQVMRENEGASLKADLTARLDSFAATITNIEAAIPTLAMQRKEKIEERLAKLLDGIDLDPVRLAQEIAILADKSDVTEELVRLRSHIDQFSNFLMADEPVGRRLDFLLQEFLREINTLASKITDATIAHQTVDLKNEVEKLREQVQNLE